jgi:hypothetical protein
MRYFLLLFLGLMLLQYQTSKKEPMLGTNFYINVHTITYKNKELPFGKPVEECVKIFGKYDRVNPLLGQNVVIRRDYIWDTLRLALEEHGEDAGKKMVAIFYIFFMNLDNPLGQMGKLEQATGRVSVAFIKGKHKKKIGLKKIIKKKNMRG